MLEKIECSFLTDNGYVSLLRLHHKVMGVISLIDRKRNLIGIRGNLNGSVGNAPVFFISGLGGKYEQSV
jgi:hypothetical protein